MDTRPSSSDTIMHDLYSMLHGSENVPDQQPVYENEQPSQCAGLIHFIALQTHNM